MDRNLQRIEYTMINSILSNKLSYRDWKTYLGLFYGLVLSENVFVKTLIDILNALINAMVTIISDDEKDEFRMDVLELLSIRKHLLETDTLDKASFKKIVLDCDSSLKLNN